MRRTEWAAALAGAVIARAHGWTVQGRVGVRRLGPAVVLIVAALLGLPAIPSGMPAPCFAQLRAQVPWDSPRMLPPDAPGGIGLYYVRFSSLPGSDHGFAVQWAPPSFPEGLRVRGGAANGARERTAGFGGVDFTGPLVEGSGDMPLNLSWSTGLGVSAGDYVLASLPVGVTAGRAWKSGQIRIGPYVGVHAVMDYRAGGSAPDEEFDVSPSGEVGLDVSFDESRRVVLRAAAALGDRSALVLGFVLGGGG